MAKISTYVIDGTIVDGDKVIGSDANNSMVTKNYTVGDLVNYFAASIGNNLLVPYNYATQDVNLGLFSLSANNLSLTGTISLSGSQGLPGQVPISNGPGNDTTWGYYVGTQTLQGVLDLGYIATEAILLNNINSRIILDTKNIDGPAAVRVTNKLPYNNTAIYASDSIHLESNQFDYSQDITIDRTEYGLAGDTVTLKTGQYNNQDLILPGVGGALLVSVNGIFGDLSGNVVVPTDLPVFTLGSVVFSDGTTFAEDNANFFWDDTNKSLGLGTNSPSISAILDLSSTTKGVLIPRMTTVERDLIASPPVGLQLFDTTLNTPVFYDGVEWKEAGGGGVLLALPFTADHLSSTNNQYVIGDTVWYLGDVYTCIANNDSILPSNATYWALIGEGFPLVQQPADWNSTSGNNQILNKPAVVPPTFESLTVTGDSGASTLLAGVLNVPTYSLSGLGGQPLATNLTSLSGLTYSSPAFVKMTAAGTFTLDTNTYLTSAVTSVGLSMPSAFNVTNSPVTSTGTLTVTGAGIASQYIRGDGTLATFPSSAGGGSSVNYYLNGSVAASVAGYKQMDNAAIIGGGTNFTLVGNGLIAQFLTDVGNPNRIEIPGGAWNFEMYFQISSSGGNSKFYVELHKYDGTTFTLISSSSIVPEAITGGTNIDLYLTSLAVPTTTLLTTDRLAVRVYIVDNSGGRTVTLHTEDNTLCEIITTFAGGVASLNGLTANTQYFAVGTSGTDFNINSLVDTHTFNLPTASATNRGALSSTDWTTFNNKAPVSASVGSNIFNYYNFI